MTVDFKIEDAWDKHHNCELVIYWKKFSNGDIVPGLYCKQFGIWIQWLDIKTADEFILDGMEVVLEQPKKKNGHPVKWITLEELGI